MENDSNVSVCAGMAEDFRSLILDNIGLVKYVVGKMRIYFKKDIEEDILGYGIVGLIEAAKRYDRQRGIKFNTFAVPRIRGAIIDYLRTQDVLPRSLRRKESDIKCVTQELEKRLKRDAKPEEIADALGLSVDEFYQIQTKLNFDYFVSLENLNKSYDNGKEGNIANVLEDNNAVASDKIAEDKEDKELLKTLVKKLPKMEKMVITLYYLEDMMIKEISKVLEISESRVSQLHHKALFSLRMHMQKAHK